MFFLILFTLNIATSLEANVQFQSCRGKHAHNKVSQSTIDHLRQFLKTPCIYLLIVANTKDRGIGKSVEVDIKNIKKSFDMIAKGMDFNICTLVLKGKTFTTADISEALKNLDTRSKDIIVFYYSGHGFNDIKLETCWPTMNIKKKVVFGGNVISSLRAKKKRGALVLFDCCNAYLLEKRMQDIRGQSFCLSKSDNLKGFCRLLLSFRGIASSAAAEVGEYATCSPSWGGTFSQGFLRSVQQLGADETVSWDKIFDLTTLTTAKIAEDVFHCDQHPIYSIEQG